MPGVNLITGTDASNTLVGGAGNDVIYGYDPNGSQSQVNSITATRLATGLNLPVFATSPTGDVDRLFILEKNGVIKILDLHTGQVRATPFLDIHTDVNSGGERGLLGLAFDPNFAQNGFFYVYLNNLNTDSEVRRYQISADPNVANAASVTPVITIDQPDGPPPPNNHKAGWLGFGPDGFLYTALGDGGTFETGQDIHTLLGKMLRLDVHADDFPGDPARNYAIPADNPFVGVDGLDEIFANGLRNPWRDSFDRAIGDFYIADVGAGRWEEVNIGQKGANYGWFAVEGPDVNDLSLVQGGPPVAPIYYYPHLSPFGNSITGGYIYRGSSEGLQGQYFFADFVTGQISTLQNVGGTWMATDRTGQIAANIGAIHNPSSFGEDAFGNLYLVDYGGDIFRLTPNTISADQGDILQGQGGNDILYDGSGNDLLTGGPGADVLIGGPGSDTAAYGLSPVPVTIDLSTGKASGGDAEGDILSGIENIIGSAFADHITGDAGINTVSYALSNAAVNVNLQNGTATGGHAQGDVLLSIESLIGSAFAAQLTGDTGNNTFEGGPLNDTIVGGGGNDTASYASSSAGVNVNLQSGAGTGGDSQGDVLSGIQNLIGSTYADHLTGDGGNNTLEGGALNDALVGGGGNDTATYASSPAGVLVSLVAGTGSGGDAEGDTLTGIANLTGSAFSDHLIGDGNPNTLDGGALDEMLDGGGGNDNLLGGIGTDTAGFGGARSQYQIKTSLDAHLQQVTDQRGGSPDGTDSLFSIESLQFSDGPINAGAGRFNSIYSLPGWSAMSGDFNGDGTSDLLWNNRSAGVLGTWLMNGGNIAQGIALNHNMPGWNSLVGDFNGDGTSDLLWDSGGSGVLGVWLMTNGQLSQGIALNHDMPGWTALVGDFNGDGTSDLLWNSGAEGVLGTWLMQNGHVAQGNALNHNMPGCNVLATGDFDGDGTTDLLWSNGAQGVLGVWLMQNGVVGQTVALNHNMPGWSVAAAGDFNHDGTTDLLWRDAIGGVGVWFMKNGNVDDGMAAGSTAGWTPLAKGDFDHNNTDDILWQSPGGTVSTWLVS